MDMRCLEHGLTAAERDTFERDGYFIVENALEPAHVARLLAATDRVEAEQRVVQGLEPQDKLAVRDFIGKDAEFVELVDWYKTFPKVWDIFGWNIQIYHSHLNVTPASGEANGQHDKGLSWHQDSDRLNRELDTSPRPRISLKVGFFLTDCSAPGRGNFHVVPGSHLQDSIDLPNGDRRADLPQGQAVLVPAGSAVFFDRRIWHSGSANYWHTPRKVLFYGYSYRWLRPRDDMTIDRFYDQLDPIRQQLFGAAPTGGYGYTSPQPEDVPLRGWLEEHLGADAVMA
jgi:ectoine hydroxylase-related dioxygenase (phytanoyl-CoA dioxygenase family)